MSHHCAGCSTTAGIAGCPEHGSNTYPRSVGQVGVNDFITNCRHGVDLRFVPRCYLCRPDGPNIDRLLTVRRWVESIGRVNADTGKRITKADALDVIDAAMRKETE